MGILDSLTNPAQVGQNALAAFDTGRKLGQETAKRNALAAYAANPNAESINALFPVAPELALKLQEHQRQREFGEAAVAMMRGEGALSGTSMPGAVGGGIGGGIAQERARLDAQAPALGEMQTTAPPQTAGVPQTATPSQNPDFRVLGAPRDQADAAFLKMLQQDPKAAFQIDSQMRDRAADRLKLQRDAYGMAVSRLVGITDQASYDAALSEVQQQVAPLGVNVTDHLPRQFPGVDGLRDLRLKAMDAKDQLTFFLQENNIDADNVRADRNTDSLITDRTERRTDQRRYNEGRLDVSRDRVDAYRDKSAQGGRSSGGRSAGGNRPAAPVKVSTPAEAMKLPKGTRYTTPDGKVMVR